MYIAPFKSEALRTRTSVFTDKEGDLQALAQLIKRCVGKVS